MAIGVDESELQVQVQHKAGYDGLTLPIQRFRSFDELLHFAESCVYGDMSNRRNNAFVDQDYPL